MDIEKVPLVSSIDPSEHSDADAPSPSGKIEDVGSTNFWGTVFLLLKTYVGAGILGLPKAYVNGHVIAGNLGIVLCALLSWYCIRLLLQVHDTMPKHITSFEEIGQEALGGKESKKGRMMHRICQATVLYTQIGFSIAYVIFVAQAFSSFASFYWRWWVLIFSVPFFLTVLQKNLKSLGWIVMFGFASIFISVCAIILYCITRCNVNLHEHATKEFLTNVELKTLPVYFGVVTYAFEGIGLVVPLKKGMMHPDRFMSAISIVYVVLVLMFCVFATTAYVTFGDNVESIITSNLPNRGSLAWLRSLMNVSISVALLLTYPLQMFPVLEIIDNWFFTPSTDNLEHKRNLVRLVMVIFTLMIAAFVPFFSLFMSLIGNLGSSLLMFILPAIFHLATCEVGPVQKAFHVGIVICGVVVCIIGTYITIEDIVDAFKNQGDMPGNLPVLGCEAQ